jgi:hypothetical protein
MLTPEQQEIRRGFQTASKAAVIMGGLETKGLSDYVRNLAGERLYGDLGEEGYKNAWMEHGNDFENPALDWFEYTHEVTIERQVFTRHPTLTTVACLPDGLCEAYTVEAKCPKWSVWCETLEQLKRGKKGLDAVPSEYRWQCRWQVWCAGVPEGRFVVYHPAGGGQGLVIPYTVDQSDFDAMAKRVVVVEGLIANWVDILRSKI